MASGNVPAFKTLKECLEFLQWLKGRKSVQSNVAEELADRLKDMYTNTNKHEIHKALSNFLDHVHTFYSNLVDSRFIRQTYVSQKETGKVLESLLDCIPKLLSAVYFLRYNVDVNFKAVGGGGWKDESVGMGSFSTLLASEGSEVDKYLYATETNTYGVIPGGFGKNDVKPGHRSGFSPACRMEMYLKNILEKHSSVNKANFFLDVFSISVLFKDSGTQKSNTANVLALVSTFCEIVADVDKRNGGEEFKKVLEEGIKRIRNCICWKQLSDHCKSLQSKLGAIFKGERFSFTGFKRRTIYLNHEEFAKSAAQWLRENLGEVKDKLKKIDASESNSKTSQGKNLADYFNTHLFPYGFTFNGSNFKTGVNPAPLIQDWRDVIREFVQQGNGLEKLKEILDGYECASRTADKASENEDLVHTKKEAPPAKVPEAPKEVVPEKVAAPQKPEISTAKESESNQNQGKKAEGAQNQGKGQGEANHGSSPRNDAKGSRPAAAPSAEPTDPSNKSSPSPEPSGAPGSGSGHDRGGQAGSSGAGQGSDHKKTKDSGGDNAAPTETVSVSGSSGAGVGGGLNQGKKKIRVLEVK